MGMLSIGYAYAQEERVGINTENPSATLSVKTKTDASSPKNLELENQAGTKLVTVLNNGRVGINTDAPKDLLHINAGTRYGAVRVEGGTAFGGAFNIVNNTKADNTTDTVPMWTLYNMTGSYGNSLQFWGYKNQTGAGAGALQGVLVLADTGNVGLSQQNPTQKLDVNGNARFRTLPNQTGAETDKVVVVDNTGVLKSVDRSSISGTSGLTSEVDGIIGNEVTDATANGGLVRSGSGTASSPYTLGLPAGTAVGQTMVWNGTAWEVKAPEAGGTLQALTGKIVKRASINAADWKTEGIFALVQTSNDTINLPNPADFENKIISVNNQYTNSINYNGTHSPANKSTLEAGHGHILMSDGTNWFVLGGSY